MIDFLITKMHDARFMTMLLAAIAASATAYTLIMPLFAGEGLAKRMKAVASERERLRQRERDRLAKSEKVSLRQTPEAARFQGGGRFQPDQMAGAGSRARQADHGRLSRPRALRHVPVCPRGDADRAVCRRGPLRVRDHADGQVADGQARHLHRRRLSRAAGPDAVPEERHQQAPALDQARLSRRARPAADLHRVRHVGRSRLPQGLHRNRRRSRSRCRRNSR